MSIHAAKRRHMLPNTTAARLQLLARWCCMATVVERAACGISMSRENSERHGSRSIAGASDDLVAAARRCVTLDESGVFPGDSTLGLFEVDSQPHTVAPNQSGMKITISAVHLEHVDGQRETGRIARDSGEAQMSLAVEIALSRRDVAAAGAQNLVAKRMEQVEPRVATGELEAAAAAATLSVSDLAEAQMAIAALACQNMLVRDTDARSVRVDVSAALGDKGTIFAASRLIVVTPDAANVSSSPCPTREERSAKMPTTYAIATFLLPEADETWGGDCEFAVADVSVFDASPVEAKTSTLSTAQFPDVPVTRATICKRASGSSGEEATKPVKAKLMSVADYQPRMRKASASPGYIITEPHLSASTRECVVAQIEDGQWWRLRDEKEHSRGMDAVNVLPRISNWRPGMWRKHRERQRKQQQEKERRQGSEGQERRRGNSQASAKKSGRGRRRIGGTNPKCFVGVAKKLVQDLRRKWDKFWRR